MSIVDVESLGEGERSGVRLVLGDSAREVSRRTSLVNLYRTGAQKRLDQTKSK
jgi:hypothetical protein